MIVRWELNIFWWLVEICVGECLVVMWMFMGVRLGFFFVLLSLGLCGDVFSVFWLRVRIRECFESI